jgi:hypothetical protein
LGGSLSAIAGILGAKEKRDRLLGESRLRINLGVSIGRQ